MPEIGNLRVISLQALSDATLGSHTSVSCLAGSLCSRAAARLERALTALGVDHDVKVYPGAGHGFINHHDPADRTLLLMFLNKVSGTRFHEPSAADAHRRIAALFSRHLATRPPSPDWMAG
jgi:acetyl esterase/lipase